MHRITDDGSVIRVTGEGFFLEEEVQSHFKALAEIIARRRRSGLQVKTWIDLRQAATQSMAVTKILAQAADQLYSDPSDRVAIIVPTMLLKIQLERVHRRQGSRICLTTREAEQFLAAAPVVTDLS